MVFIKWHLFFRTRWSNIVHITSKKTSATTTSTNTNNTTTSPSSSEQRSTPETITVSLFRCSLFANFCSKTAWQTDFRSLRLPRWSASWPVADLCQQFNRGNNGQAERATGNGPPWRGVRPEPNWRVDLPRAVRVDIGMCVLSWCSTMSERAILHLILVLLAKLQATVDPPFTVVVLET